MKIKAGLSAIALALFATCAWCQPVLKSPVVVNVTDVGGALALLQDAIEAYKTRNPQVVSRFTFTKAPAPELPGKIKAMQAANRTDIDLVLGGLDILSAGIEQGLWTTILPQHAARVPNVLENYPTGTGVTMRELGEGSRDMTVTVTGWDINPRALGIVPKNYKVAAFDNMTWVNDTQYLMVPKGLSQEKLAVVLDLMAFLLKPEQQALTYDKGYFYPGPAVKDVSLSMAPKESQDVIKEYGR